MRAEPFWWLALAALAAAVGLAILTGPSNLTTAAAFVATGLTILAAVVDDPRSARSARDDRRRPW